MPSTESDKIRERAIALVRELQDCERSAQVGIDSVSGLRIQEALKAGTSRPLVLGRKS